MALRRALVSMSVVLALVAGALATNVAPAAAASTIESKYKVAGTWSVTTANVTNGSGAVIYNLFYPANLGANGFKHPIITWGNGTNAVPSQYTGVLNQLASWGFVVVASTSKTTGTGTEILAGANYLVTQNGTVGSTFYQKLDTAKVGAIGHSQGAGGVTRAAISQPNLIKTVVPIALPDQIWVAAGDAFNVAQLTRPVFFVGGSGDWLIAPPATLQGYYNNVPGAAALGVLKGAGHNTIQGTGGDFLGYITAWMMYQLQGDAYARGAFVGAPPELNTNTAWQNQAEKNLP
jgi:hypothetical protein